MASHSFRVVVVSVLETTRTSDNHVTSLPPLQAISIMMRVYTRWPRLISLTHGAGPFLNEHAFHVLAANRREKELTQALEIARLRLADNTYSSLLNAQVRG